MPRRRSAHPGSAPLLGDYRHIKQSRAFGMAGIFRPLKRTEQRQGGLDVSYPWRETYKDHGVEEIVEKHVRVTCFEPLGSDDQLVFLAILALATPQSRGQILTRTSQTEWGKWLHVQLWGLEQNLRSNPFIDDYKCVVIHTTCYELLRTAGLGDGGYAYQHLRDILYRLSQVDLCVDDGRQQYDVKLLSAQLDLKDQGFLSIAINPVSSSAILGGQYLYIDLGEYLAMPTDIAKILFAWLCAWLRQGKRGKIFLDNLAGHVWPHYRDLTDSGQRTFRQRLKTALTSIDALPNWRVSMDGQGTKALAYIHRSRPPEKGFDRPAGEERALA